MQPVSDKMQPVSHQMHQHVSPPNCISMCHQIAAACVTTKLQQHVSPNCSMCHQIVAACVTKLQQHVSSNCSVCHHQIAAACVTKLQQNVSPNCSMCHQIAECVTKLQRVSPPNGSSMCHQIAAARVTKLQRVSLNCSMCHQIAAASCVTKLQHVSPNYSMRHQIAACVTRLQRVSPDCSMCHHQTPLPQLLTLLCVVLSSDVSWRAPLFSYFLLLSPGRNWRETGSDIILRCQSIRPAIVKDTIAGRKLLGAPESATRRAKRPQMKRHVCNLVASHCIRRPNTVH
ncbi:hypothetical protein AB205_0203990, partial [Aquarana catesbeiana]